MLGITRVPQPSVAWQKVTFLAVKGLSPARSIFAQRGREDAHLHGHLAGKQDHPGRPAEGEGRPRRAGYLGATVSPAAPGSRQLTEALGGSAPQREKAPQPQGQRHD